jgi:hypothetical protein
MESNFISISEAKQGDKIAFYGATMIVTNDAYVSPNFTEATVYIAKCELLDNGHSTSIDILKNYDFFQGTAEVQLLKIN